MKNELGDRMKDFYENRTKTSLPRRSNVIVRIDGNSFHTFTRKFKKPYDEVFHNAMNDTVLYLCSHIQGCKLGYTQSDEISLLLTDYDTLTTSAWFDYEVQKICSISSAMATMAFNKAFEKYAGEYIDEVYEEWNPSQEEENLCNAYRKAIENGAFFDARCFTLPDDEVVNCFIWRQQDATRNAIQMLGHCNFSTSELNGISNDKLQDMLFTEKGINFNDMPVEYKRGVCVIKHQTELKTEHGQIIRDKWVVDRNIPIFTQNKEYINSVLPGRNVK